MATTIKLKNGSGAPLAGDLVQGEPALDLTNKRLYTENSGGTVIEIGTNPSTIDINAGTIDGTVIGGASAAAGTFTNLTATGTVTLPANGVSGDAIDGGTISNFASTGIDDNATSTAITIDSSQNVGIGTASPTGVGSYKILQVRGSSTSNGGLIRLETSDGTSGVARLYAGSGSTVLESNSNTPLVFGTNATERMRIDSSGNLLVGTTSQIGASRFSSVATGNNTPISGQNGATVTTVPLFNLYSNVGGTGTLRFQIQADGDAFNSNNSYGALSDERLKSNIVDASSQLDDIMAVQVRSYTLNATGDTHIGVVAQELEASGMSGLVKENQEGMKAVKYSVLYMKALKALQEAVTRIETLEAEVALLKGAN